MADPKRQSDNGTQSCGVVDAIVIVTALVIGSKTKSKGAGLR